MIDLDELMKLREAATPGPWKTDLGNFDSDGYSMVIRPYIEADGKITFVSNDDTDYGYDENDAAYIVAACNAVPELVARIRELEAELKRRDAQRWADLCNECATDYSCPYIGPCPFVGKKCGDVRQEDWIKWLEAEE